jgi:hypothetical protein
VQRPEEPAEWDLSVALLSQPSSDTTFAYCTLCLALHFPAGVGAESEAEDEAELEAVREAVQVPQAPCVEVPHLH